MLVVSQTGWIPLAAKALKRASCISDADLCQVNGVQLKRDNKRGTVSKQKHLTKRCLDLGRRRRPQQMSEGLDGHDATRGDAKQCAVDAT